MHRTQIYLPYSLRQQIAVVSKATGETMSEIIRIATAEFVTKFAKIKSKKKSKKSESKEFFANLSGSWKDNDLDVMVTRKANERKIYAH